MRWVGFRCPAGVSFVLIVSLAIAADKARRPGPIRYGKPRHLCTLACRQIDESSGLAPSRRTPGVFWTQNDSGSPAELFAFDRRGRHLGAYTVIGARNRDWEDLAWLTVGKKHFLLICDTGDNALIRPFVSLYLVPEPAVDPNRPKAGGKLRVARAIHFTYEDGPQDCESVAVDPTTKTIYLVSKRGKRTVYELPMPPKAARRKLVAKAVAELDIAAAVAMDISGDGLRAVVLTYGLAFEYTRAAGEKWAAAFRRGGRKLRMPGRRQGESICYGPDGKTLYLTSEKLPTPLLEVPALTEGGKR